MQSAPRRSAVCRRNFRTAPTSPHPFAEVRWVDDARWRRQYSSTILQTFIAQINQGYHCTLMTSCCTSLSPLIHPMLKYSKTSTASSSGLRITCCLSISRCMLLTNKYNISVQTILLNNEPLEFVQHYKYLGVTVSHNLSWSHHIQDICKKARKVLGAIYHRISKNTNDSLTVLKLYTALVRPHLEYAAQVWNPHLEKDIQCLEKVQKFALRICTKDYHVSYEHLLDVFFIPSLRNRRLFLSLCSFYCIVKGLVHFPHQSIVHHPTMSSSRYYNPHSYIVPYARCNALKFSFFCTVIRLWNFLPLEALTAEQLLEFKHFISPLFLTP